MAKLTRRTALGLGTSAFGLVACAGGTEESGTDTAEVYEGSVSFDHGVASGDPLSQSVILWTRITPQETSGDQVPVKWSIRAAGNESDNKSGVVYAKRSSDWCVKVDVDGLTADTVYDFEFAVETTGGEIKSPAGKTRTTPASGDREIKLAIVSCSNYPFGRFNVYEALSGRDDLDAIVHLGDYLYEYGPDGYGGDIGESIGRPHDPPHEIITLQDYRARHAQYKSDPQLQMAHAAAPWICTWDDHESANNSYRTGAENHDPEKGEGSWSDRKQIALQAYMEWMPVREPKPGKARSAFWRRFDFGDVASLMCLETRLTGRSEEISWASEMQNVSGTIETLAKAKEVMDRVEDPGRTMLGAEQETWLAEQLRQSARGGKAWQVLGNQTIMARVRPPNFPKVLTDDQISAQSHPLIQRLIEFSQLGLPFNLDSWDGFPAARDRLYEAASDANAKLVTLTGDTHTAWANRLQDNAGEWRGVEFGCTSVTSPGLGLIMTDIPNLGELFVDANEEVEMHRTVGQGFTIVSLTPSQVSGEFYEVSSITDEEFTVSLVDSFVQAAP